MERYFVMSMGKENYAPGLHMIAATRKGMIKSAAVALARKLTAEDPNNARYFVGTVIAYYQRTAPIPPPVEYIPITPQQYTIDFPAIEYKDGL